MKKISRLQVTAWVLSLLPAAMTAVFYSRLPAEIPMQWDLAGHMNYETRWHLWIVAGMAPLFAVLFYFLPRFDPKSKNYDKFSDAYIGFQIMIDLFLTAMCGICIAEALRPGTVDVPTVVCLLVSLLVMCLGNIMPKFRMNWYCGLKTPWTLSSETVWTRTHRVAGRMMFAAGIIGAAGSFVPNEIAKFVLVLAPMAADYLDCSELAMVPRRTAVIDEKWTLKARFAGKPRFSCIKRLKLQNGYNKFSHILTCQVGNGVL